MIFYCSTLYLLSSWVEWSRSSTRGCLLSPRSPHSCTFSAILGFVPQSFSSSENFLHDDWDIERLRVGAGNESTSRLRILGYYWQPIDISQIFPQHNFVSHFPPLTLSRETKNKIESYLESFLYNVCECQTVKPTGWRGQPLESFLE